MANETIFTRPRSLDEPYPDVRAVIQQQGEFLPADALNGADWSFANAESAVRLHTMATAGKPLSEYVRGGIYYGVKTGFNTAFVLDDATRARLIADDAKSAEIIKPLVVGKDIHKWRIIDRDRWLIFTRRGTKIDAYPAIKAHLEQWHTDLEPKPRNWPSSLEWPGRKPGSYKWYEIQDEVAYYAMFDQPKIIFPDIAKEPRFAFDTTGTFTNDTTFIMITDDLYLLSVLNSSSVTDYFIEMGAQVRGGYLRFKRQYVERIPIPNAPASERTAIADLVQHCLDARGVGCAEWEAEIDARVARLYGLQE